MRIIAGRFRGRRLKGTPPEGVRPTSDRLRETLFNILGDSVIESVFLDAYAGTGAVGLEAISRGAGRVRFVDRSRQTVALIRSNAEALGISQDVRVLHMEVRSAIALSAAERGHFDIVFLDPPYGGTELYVADLERLGTEGVVAEHGVVIVEHSSNLELPTKAGSLARTRRTRQGDSALTFYGPEVSSETNDGDLPGYIRPGHERSP